eukprot:gene14010-19944_t
MTLTAENGNAEPGPVNVAEVEITAPAQVTDPADNTSSSGNAPNPTLAADASTGADNCANSAEPHATRVFKTNPILDPPDLSPGDSVETATKSAMSSTDSLADRVADFPMYKEKENSKQQGGIEVYSIHGEQHAKHVASAEGAFSVVQWLIEEEKSPVNVLDRHKKTPLEEAAMNDHAEVVKLLLWHGGCVFEDKQLVSLEKSKLRGIVNVRRMKLIDLGWDLGAQQLLNMDLIRLDSEPLNRHNGPNKLRPTDGSTPAGWEPFRSTDDDDPLMSRRAAPSAVSLASDHRAGLYSLHPPVDGATFHTHAASSPALFAHFQLMGRPLHTPTPHTLLAAAQSVALPHPFDALASSAPPHQAGVSAPLGTDLYKRGNSNSQYHHSHSLDFSQLPSNLEHTHGQQLTTIESRIPIFDLGRPSTSTSAAATAAAALATVANQCAKPQWPAGLPPPVPKPASNTSPFLTHAMTFSFPATHMIQAGSDIPSSSGAPAPFPFANHAPSTDAIIPFPNLQPPQGPPDTPMGTSPPLSGAAPPEYSSPQSGPTHTEAGGSSSSNTGTPHQRPTLINGSYDQQPMPIVKLPSWVPANHHFHQQLQNGSSCGGAAGSTPLGGNAHPLVSRPHKSTPGGGSNSFADPFAELSPFTAGTGAPMPHRISSPGLTQVDERTQPGGGRCSANGGTGDTLSGHHMAHAETGNGKIDSCSSASKPVSISPFAVAAAAAATAAGGFGPPSDCGRDQAPVSTSSLTSGASPMYAPHPGVHGSTHSASTSFYPAMGSSAQGSASTSQGTTGGAELGAEGTTQPSAMRISMRQQLHGLYYQDQHGLPTGKVSIFQSSPSFPLGIGGTHRNWEIEFCELEYGQRIGIGSYGEVYKGVWRGTEVAIKKLLEQHLSPASLRDFRDEVSMMSILRHPNIVQFLGAVVLEAQLAIITAFVPRGSLFRILHRARADLDPRRRLNIALDIARGMCYLHNCKPMIVHRDLKSPNLLVDKDG